MTEAPGLAAAYDRVATHLVGRERELTLVLAAVAAGGPRDEGHLPCYSSRHG